MIFLSELELVPLYGKLDYPSVIARQLDRILSIRSQISTPVNKVLLSRLRSAIVALWLISPRSVREEVGEPPSTTLEELDTFFIRLRDALEKHGLIGVRILEVGRPDVDVYEESSAGL